MSFTLSALPYAYDALEGVIDKETMQIHHDKHHQTYVDKLNAALEGEAVLVGVSLEDLLLNLEAKVPQAKQSAVRNHAGGHHNHSLFWEIMTPGGSNVPTGDLAIAINNLSGDFANFKTSFAEKAASQFGSGWAWLVKKADASVEIISLPNQDSPLLQGLTPLMGLDVWEHAYYLKYQNRRPEYIAAWWQVLNWDKVAENYAK